MQEPLSVAAFSVALRVPFRGMRHREGLLIEGPAGWGEFSPLPGAGAAEVRRCYDAACEAAVTPWPAPVRDRVPVNVTIPAVEPARAHALVAGGGCGTAKVKVAEPGQSLDDDIARLEAVRDALGPDGRLRIDANAGWEVEAAVRAIGILSRFELEYVEQPCPNLAELAQVRRRVEVPIAADESIRGAEDPQRVRAAGAADLLVLKAAPLGGVRSTIAIAERCGLPVVVSSALETSVGLAAGVALAAALPELPYACGLGTAVLLARDVVDDPLLPAGGVLAVRRPTVRASALDRHQPTDVADTPSASAAEWARARWPELAGALGVR